MMTILKIAMMAMIVVGGCWLSATILSIIFSDNESDQFGDGGEW
jgi:hypothetical protein